jgi:hypothetical protein
VVEGVGQTKTAVNLSGLGRKWKGYEVARSLQVRGSIVQREVGAARAVAAHGGASTDEGSFSHVARPALPACLPTTAPPLKTMWGLELGAGEIAASAWAKGGVLRKLGPAGQLSLSLLRAKTPSFICTFTVGEAGYDDHCSLSLSLSVSHEFL